jgi:hypothetical protein
MNAAAKDLIKKTFDEKILPYLAKKEPEIKAIVQEKAGDAVKSIASNDALCTSVFEKVHELLPAPLKLVVNKDTFVKYCMDNKLTVLNALHIK